MAIGPSNVIPVADLPERPSGSLDSVVGVNESGDQAVKFRIDDFPISSATQFQIDNLIAGQQTDSIYVNTLSDLQSIPGSFTNQGAFVVNGDESGQYRWTGSSWQFLRPDLLTEKADIEYVDDVTAHVPQVDASLSEFQVIQNVIVGPNKARSRTTGLEITQTGYQYSGFDLTGHEISIRASAYVNHSGVAMAVYFDASNNFLGMEFPGGTGNEPFEHINQILTPPSNARRVYISTNTAFPTQLKFEIRSITPDVAFRLKSVEAGTAEIPQIKSSLSAWVEQSFTTVDGSYISKSTGAVIVNSSFIYTKLAVDPTEPVRVSARVQGTAVALAVYYSNADGTGYIGYEVDGTGTPVDYKNYQLTVPSNARSIGIVSRVGFPISIQKIGLAPDLAIRVEALENAGPPLPAISLFGDSMIADAATGIAPELSAALPTRTIYKQGIGGQDALQVAARMGAIPITISVTGNIIPSTGSVTCTPNIDLLRRSGGIATCKVMVQGVLCALTFDFSLNSGAGGYYLTPIVYPANNMTVVANVPATVLSGWVSGSSSAACVSLGKLLGGTVIVRVDRNDADPSNSVEDVISQNQAIVRQIQRFSQKWIWIGTTNGYSDKTVADGGTRNSADSSYAYLSRIAAFNNTSRELFSENFLDALANHVVLGGGQAYTVLGRTFDVLTNLVLSDGVHENTLGKNQTVQLITNFLAERKW